MRHTEKECGLLHCRCMEKDCSNNHYADHVQHCGHTATEHNYHGCKNVTLSTPTPKTVEADNVSSIINQFEHLYTSNGDGTELCIEGEKGCVCGALNFLREALPALLGGIRDEIAAGKEEASPIDDEDSPFRRTYNAAKDADIAIVDKYL